MSKVINVADHVKRYEDTDLNLVNDFIDGLQEMKERRTKEEIERYEAALEKLRNGEIPPAEPKPVTRTRKRKTKEVSE